MTESVLKNNYSEFDPCIKQRISGTNIGTEFSPPHACIFMDKMESAFLESESAKPWVWMRYIDDIFFIWTESEDELEGFLQCLHAFHPNLKCTHEKSEVSINFLEVIASINGEEFETDLYGKPTEFHEFLEFNSTILFIIKNRLCIAKGCALKGCVPRKIRLKNTLKVYVLGLTSAVIPRNLLTIKLGGFLKAKQNSYLNVTQKPGLVYHLL